MIEMNARHKKAGRQSVAFCGLFGHLLAATADERRSKSKAPEGTRRSGAQIALF